MKLASRWMVAVAVVALAACSRKVEEPTPEPRSSAGATPEAAEPAELVKEDLVVGSGAEAKDGDHVTVNYAGRLASTNFKFDSNEGKKPFPVDIGKGGVIKGWDLGLVGMKVGGKRRLTIPSRLAYGDKGQPPKIPAKATLIFDIELLSVGEEKDAGASDAGGSDGGTKGEKKKKK